MDDGRNRLTDYEKFIIYKDSIVTEQNRLTLHLRKAGIHNRKICVVCKNSNTVIKLYEESIMEYRMKYLKRKSSDT